MPTRKTIVVSGFLFTLCAAFAATAASAFVVTNVNDSGAGSLRQAMLDANANAGLDLIEFNIPGAGVHTIQPLSALPAITDPVVIDGYTQPGALPNTNPPALGSNAMLLIEIDGGSAGGGVAGVHITGGGSTVRGLVVNRFTANGSGIRLESLLGGNIVEGCFIGTDAAGTTALGNSAGVAVIGSRDNRIGGTAPASRNVISGNVFGIQIVGGPGGNTIQGNLVGLAASGTTGVPNTSGGLLIDGGANTVGGSTAGAGNVISANTLIGLQLMSDGNRVQGNFIGTDVTGAVALGNGSVGIAVSSANDTIGGAVAGARNVVSGNTSVGVSLSGNAVAGVVITGNYIGTDVTGTVALANGSDGVQIGGGTGTIVGGTTPAYRNIISGNTGNGVNIAGTSTSGNFIQGNYIGTDDTGETALGNASRGVVITASGNIVGGTAAGAGNVISGNALRGIDIVGLAATGNVVQGNYIGISASGSAALPNGAHGILIGVGSSGNTIGGTAPGAGNVISGNGSYGVFISGTGGTSTGNVLQGNLIGTDPSGLMALGNSAYGVSIGPDAPNNTIGGPSAGNTIAFNGAAGVAVSSTSTGNAILSNSIHSNTGLGIDLGTNGITPNDAGDADTGANDLQNFPVIAAATPDGGTRIQGSFNSTANDTFTLQFFSNASCDPLGNGEGRTFLGETGIATDGSGNAPFDVTFGVTVPLGEFVTATATDTSGNTSEFAACVPMSAAPALPDLVVESLTHAPATPTDQDTITFTATVKNIGAGPAAASTVNFKIGDDTLGQDFAVPALLPGETFAAQRSEVLPPQGYLNRATADANGAVAESDETNNVTTDTFSVLPFDADGDGVGVFADLCPTEDASFFDRDGDGCIDDVVGTRRLEYWAPENMPVPYFIHANGAPGIGDGSDFLAVQAGVAAWSGVPGAEVSSSFQGTATQKDAQALDGVNLVTFEDPDFVFPSGVLAVGISTSFTVPTMFGGELVRPGRIVDADMIFNTGASFKTPSAGPATGIDIQSVAAHEAGHLFGISHSAVQTSTMFFVLPPGADAATLAPEDQLMILRAYPDSITLADETRLVGTVTDGLTGAPVPGVIVYAIDAVTGDTLGCDYTLPADGGFSFLGLPAGDYHVAIHPLNGASTIGFISPANINALVFDTAVTTVVPEFWDAAESNNDDPLARDPIAVSAGSPAVVSIVTNVDQTGPVVTEAFPDSNTTDVSVDAAVLVSFSEPIASSSVSGNFALTDTATNVFIGGSAAVLEDDSTIAFIPAGNLAFDTVYRLRLGTGLTDQFGNGLAAPFVMHFKTQVQPDVAAANLTPGKGVAGAVVVVNGFGFDPSPANNAVSFGGAPAAVVSASPTQVAFEVPAGAAPGAVPVTVTNLVKSQTSVPPLTFTVLAAGEVAKGFEAAVVDLTGLPRSIAVVPDGSRAFVATDAGVSVVGVDPGLPDYKLHTPISIPGGLNEIGATPDGQTVFAVSRVNRKLYRIDADPPGVLNEIDVGAEARGVLVAPSGRRAYVATDASEVQVWDINETSPTFERQIGMIPSPSNLRAKMATTPAGDLLLGLSGTGDLLVFDLAGDSLEATIPVRPDPRDVAVDPAGQLAYVTDGAGVVTVVSLGSFLAVTDISTGGTLRGIAVTPAGSFAYAANRELNFLDAVDLRRGSATFRSVAANILVRTNPVDVVLSPDGALAFSLSELERKLVITAIGTGPALQTLSPQAAPAGARVVLSGSGFTADSLTTVSFNGAIAVPEALADSALTVVVPSGATSGPVTVLGTNPAPPVAVSNAIFFDVLGASPPGGLRLAAKAAPAGTPSLTSALAVAPGGGLVAVGDFAGKVHLLDTDPASPTFNRFIGVVPVLTSPPVDIAVTPDGRRAFAVPDSEAVVAVVNINRHSGDFATAVDSIDLTGGGSTLHSLAVSPDGSWLLVSDPGLGKVHVVDIRPGSPQQNEVIAAAPVADASIGLNGAADEMAFYPGGQVAYVAMRDDSPAAIRVIRMDAAGPAFGTVVNTVLLPAGTPDEVPVSLSFTPDGSRCFVMTTQLTGPPNRTIVTLRTTAPGSPAHPVVDGVQAFPTASVAIRENVRVSPRGDRAVLNILGDGFFDVDITASPALTVLDQSAGGLHAGRIDFDYAPDASRLYAVSTVDDTVFVYDFTSAQHLAKVSGDGQTGVVNEVLSTPLRVRALNSTTGLPTPGVPVTFDVAAGGGAFVTADPTLSPTTQVVVTDADGVAEVRWALGPVVGPNAQTVQASSVGLSGSPAVFVATSLDDPNLLPLTIGDIVPAANQTHVSITTAILVAFSRAVDTTSVDNSTFFLMDSATSSVVPAVTGFTDANRKLSLTPVDPLEPGTAYTIVVTPGLKDTSGGALVAGASSTFTTTPPPPLALNSVSPPSATTTVGVVLSGTGFDAVAANNTVLFNDIEGVVTGAGTDFIDVNVPLGATSGDIRVVAAADTSNALPFTVLEPVTSASDDVLATVGTGSATRSISITPDGARAYGVSPDANTVVPIDLSGFSAFPAIPVGDNPFAITIHPDGSFAYVTNLLSGTVSVIGVDNGVPATFNQVVETIAVGANPVDLAVTPDGDRVIVANIGSSDLSVIDVDSTSETFHSVLATVGTGSTTRSISITPDGGRLYVGTDGGYLVMDALDFGVLRTVGTGSATRNISITPDGTLAVLLTNDGDVLIVDIAPGSPTEDQVLATVGRGTTTRNISITPDGALLYLVQEEGDIILVVSLDVGTSVAVIDPNAAVRTIEVAIVDTIATVGEDPSSVAFDPSGSGRAVVTSLDKVTILGIGNDGAIRGTVTADCPAPGTPLFNVEIDVFEAGTGNLAAVLTSDTAGHYAGSLAAGDYTLAAVAPLGFTIAGGDSLVTITGGDTLAVDFPFACEAVPADPRKKSFWKHQVGVAVKLLDMEDKEDEDDHGTHHGTHHGEKDDDEHGNKHHDKKFNKNIEFDGVALCGFLDLIAEHFNNAGLNPIIVYQPPASGLCEDKLRTAGSLLNPEGEESERAEATEELMALLLNVASAKLSLTAVASTDSASVSQAIAYVDQLIDDGDPANDALAKEIAKKINKGKKVAAGVIPLDIADIAYTPGRIPGRFDLGQNYPNPFNPATTIRFALPVRTHVRLTVYDVAGRRVATLVDETRPAGAHRVVWDRMSRSGNPVASGVYFYRIEAGKFKMTKKMVLLK